VTTLTKEEATRLERGARAYQAITGQRIKSVEMMPGDRPSLVGGLAEDGRSFVEQIKAIAPELAHAETSLLLELLREMQAALSKRYKETYPE
jgi:hypothetical protein